MISKTHLAGAAVAAGVLLSGLSAHAANIVQNGGFDLDTPSSGAPLDWTLTEAADLSNFFVGNDSADTPSPPNSANFGAEGNDDDVLSQILPTIAGHMYRISFDLAHTGTNIQNDFSADFGGMKVLTLMDSASFGFTHFTFVATTLTGATTLAFAGREVPARYLLDNVSVEDVSSVPEPAAWTMMIMGFMGAGTLLRRRRLAVAA